MTEAINKLLGVKRLPIFPLPLVLFPNELLPLHIFEPRYRRMLKDIQAGNGLFGVSYLNQDETDSNVPPVGSVGCVAELREAQTLEDGRSNILTVGVIRYEIEGYVDEGEPYLTAEVNFFEDFEADESKLNPLADKVFNLFTRAAKAALDLSGQTGKFENPPQAEPQNLSFLVAAAFNLPNDLKREFLESRSTVNRLEKLEEILIQAVRQTEESAQIVKASKTNGHSKKKIDLD